MPRSADRT